MRAGMKEDLEFATKVFDLGEYDLAAKMCCDLIKRLDNSPEQTYHAVNDFRSLLIRSMTEIWRSGEPSEPILEELDRLFTGYLTVKDRVSAAGTLLQKAEFLEDLDWPARSRRVSKPSICSQNQQTRTFCERFAASTRSCLPTWMVTTRGFMKSAPITRGFLKTRSLKAKWAFQRSLGSFTQRYVKRHGPRRPFRPDFGVPGYDLAENIGRRPSSRS